ncbi:hypothetical protein NX774_02185 [Massilia agilis]|uniref:DUF2147 domain-containing protein n=1 Tax=Massilia agilis TaxID=1811226 RepID=A0ABT2D7E2_9BURK|nr:hypothetical protein [Massilia agilis]MCS0806734.1 hypothetical protein [Massilia agilis]
MATAIGLAASAPSYAGQAGHEIIGNWKFTSVLDGVDIAQMDEKQAQHLLGRVMTIRKDGIRFGDERCGADDFEVKRVEPNLYLDSEARISAAKLYLPNPVTVVDTGCTQVFIKKPNKVVIFWNGFFFDAVRVPDSPGSKHR